MEEIISFLAAQCREVVQAGSAEGEEFPQWPLEVYESELRKDSLYCILVFRSMGSTEKVLRSWGAPISNILPGTILSSDRRLEAFAFFHRCGEGVYEVGFLGCREKGSGMGRRLMHELIEWINEKDSCEKKELILEVRTDNDRAARFYEKQGFKEVGYRKSYYPDGCDARVLVKDWCGTHA